MAVNLDKYLVTEKQKKFPYDFIVGADSYEVWDEIEIGKEYTAPIKYEVKAEDIINCSQSANDDNPALSNQEKAKETPFKGLIAHPLFLAPVGFFCVRSGAGSWIRTPGARNPGQRIEWYEPIRPGDILTLHMKSYDKWIKAKVLFDLRDQVRRPARTTQGDSGPLWFCLRHVMTYVNLCVLSMDFGPDRR